MKKLNLSQKCTTSSASGHDLQKSCELIDHIKELFLEVTDAFSNKIKY